MDKSDYDLFTRTLEYVLDRPTPMQVVTSDEDSFRQPREMSIMKQSLLYGERKATVSIYKIAELLEIYLNNVIDCIEDLVIIFERLSAQQYSLLLSKFERNMHTAAIREAIMDKRGEKSKLVTFIQ